MNVLTEYPYIRANILEERNTYFFSQYAGHDFLRAWRHSRFPFTLKKKSTKTEQPFFQLNSELIPTPDMSGLYACSDILNFIWYKLTTNDYYSAQPFLDRLLQRFEVTKRIFEFYDSEISAKGRTDYLILSNYIGFALVLGQAMVQTLNLKYLNALFKVNDIIVSVQLQLTDEEMEWASRAVAVEEQCVQQLLQKMNIQ
jgi:hypothetical protein